MDIALEPLTPEAFAPFGRVVRVREPQAETEQFVADVENRRGDARLNVGISRAKPTPLPLRLHVLERHDHSSQLFVPLAASRWLAVVASADGNGEPRHDTLRAFVAATDQGICYAPMVWHHPFVCIDGPAEMLMLRWDDGTEADTSWHRIPDTVRITLVER